MPGNGKIVVKKGKIFLAALARRPQYFASSKMRGEFEAPSDARQFRMRISRNVSAVTAEPQTRIGENHEYQNLAVHRLVAVLFTLPARFARIGAIHRGRAASGRCWTRAAAPSRARVTVTQTATGASRTVTTDADGGYSFPNLPVGPYQLQVRKQGFSAYVQTGIVLQVNVNPTIIATLKVGAVTDQVQVTSDAALVETRSNGVGQVIDQQRVVELPLNGRGDRIDFPFGLVDGGSGGGFEYE